MQKEWPEGVLLLLLCSDIPQLGDYFFQNLSCSAFPSSSRMHLCMHIAVCITIIHSCVYDYVQYVQIKEIIVKQLKNIYKKASVH